MKYGSEEPPEEPEVHPPQSNEPPAYTTISLIVAERRPQSSLPYHLRAYTINNHSSDQRYIEPRLRPSLGDGCCWILAVVLIAGFLSWYFSTVQINDNPGNHTGNAFS